MVIPHPLIYDLCIVIRFRSLPVVAPLVVPQLGRTRKALHLSSSGYLIESVMNTQSGWGEAGGNYLPNGRCPTLFGQLFPTIGLTVPAFSQVNFMM